MRWMIWMFIVVLAGCSDDTPRAFGVVERDRLTLSAPVGTTIRAIPVHEGQRVSAGEVLLILDDTQAQARIRQRTAELEQARANLEELEHGTRVEELAKARAVVSGATASLLEAELALERTERLYASNARSKSDLDAARAARDIAEAKQAEAQQNLLELENGTRSERLDQARAAVEVAAAILAQEEKTLSDLTLVASQEATVDVISWREGDRVAADTQLIALSVINSPYVRVYLPSTWLDRVHTGDHLEIHVDGREQALDGVVRNIRSQPAYTPFFALNERDRARLMYLSDIALPEDGSDLPSGMAVEVELPR